MRKVRDTGFHSKVVSRMPDGCRLCVRGAKLVLFVTGLCGRGCFYCPLSERRRGRDVTVANEWWIKRPQDILEEARLCESLGAGLTGGDPLVKLGRTLGYIRMLKREFGRDFHVHLYTPGNLASESVLRRLHEAGLDEIRFHPSKADWSKIKLARRFDWSVGCEIPALPGGFEGARELVDFMEGAGADFLNVNELEVSDTNYDALVARGFRVRGDESSAVFGSEETARRLLGYCAKNTSLNAHYCTIKLKDRVQLGNRIKRRARNVKKPYDIVEREGILLRGVIYLPDYMPSFGYESVIESVDSKRRRALIARLRKIRDNIRREYSIPNELIEVDGRRLRVLTAPWVVEGIAPSLRRMGLKPALVWEYPTWDALITELTYL